MRILLVVYDNESFISFLPQGLAYITSVLKKEGHEVIFYNQDIHHYPDEHLTKYLNENDKFDAIGISFIAGYYQYKKILKISDAINKSFRRPDMFVLGGHGPYSEPEYFLRKTKADIVVLGEGEETAKELFSGTPLKEVKGIAYLDNDKFFINQRRSLISDIDNILIPAYEELPIENYRLIRFPGASNTDFCLPVLSGRGCWGRCNFCQRMDKGFRARKVEKVLEEIELLKSKWGINYILFSDELFMSSVKRTIEFCDGIIQSKLNFKWSCNGRLNIAKKNVVQKMKEAGCVKINYGIESMDDIALKNMKKDLTVKQIEEGIKNTLDIGISPGFNIIFGNIGETKEILQKGVDFLLKYDNHIEMRTIRPVTPYPGSPLYYYAIQKGLLKGVEDFYENKHLNSDLLTVNFIDMSDDEFHKCLFDANKQLIEKYCEDTKKNFINQAKELYVNKDITFRGFRRT